MHISLPGVIDLVQFTRIGDKVISLDKLIETVEKIIEMRAKGLSQQEVADRLDLDRPFISRLEALGEVRKGQRVAVVGFPVANKDELTAVAEEQGVDFVYLMTNSERWDYVRNRSGVELVNDIMRLIALLRSYDTVIFLGSDMRVDAARALLTSEIVGLEIGTSPIKEDVRVDPEELRSIIASIRGERKNAGDETV